MKIDYKKIATSLIDLYINMFGIIRAIQYLIDLGIDKDQDLIDLGFEMNDIIDAKNNEVEGQG